MKVRKSGVPKFFPKIGVSRGQLPIGDGMRFRHFGTDESTVPRSRSSRVALASPDFLGKPHWRRGSESAWRQARDGRTTNGLPGRVSGNHRCERIALLRALSTVLPIRRRFLERLGRGRRSVGNHVRRDGRSVARDPIPAEPAAWRGGRADGPSDPHNRSRIRRSHRN